MIFSRSGPMLDASGVRRWLHKWVEPAQARWQGLPLRERRLLIVAVAVVVLAAGWLGVANPALKRIAYWNAELPALQTQATELDALLTQSGKGARTQSSLGEPLVQLRASLDQAGMAGQYEIEGGGEGASGEMRIRWVKPVPADRVLSWLLAVPGQLGIRVLEVDLQRPDASASPDAGAGQITGTAKIGWRVSAS